MEQTHEIPLETLFEPLAGGTPLTTCWDAARARVESGDVSLVVDRFTDLDAACVAMRIRGPTRIRLVVHDCRALDLVAAGGWSIAAGEAPHNHYWIPSPPILHEVEPLGRIRAERPATVASMSIVPGKWDVTYDVPDGQFLDVTAWRLDSRTAAELRTLAPIERQGLFLWGSHTRFSRPSDLYRHQIHGLIYEDRYEWPKRWRICSENDAHALFVCCTGLERATSKTIYRLMRTQILLAVLARQGVDGGYHHGTWTDDLESHYRLHASAMHLFMDAIGEREDAALSAALERAMDFATAQVDHTVLGAWFLHDELEKTTEGMNRGPFRWIPSRTLGKSPPNMLVLNTHLDTLVASLRHAATTGSVKFTALNESARQMALAVIEANPAEWLYRLVFRLVGLTLLPTSRAAALPLPTRALKRLTWRYLIPRLPALKTRFPRLVMPGGYVDRAISLQNWSHRYLSINAMDLARISRRLPLDARFRETAFNALRFAADSGLAEKWKEQPADRYSIGFLAEALCHACTLDAAHDWRQLLAAQLFALHDLDQGFPPTALGCNSELAPFPAHAPCPLVLDDALRVASLPSPRGRELLVLNTALAPIEVHWESPPPAQTRWTDENGREIDPNSPLPARGWRLGTVA